MPHRIIHTISFITQNAVLAADAAPNVGTSPVKLFDGQEIQAGEVIHIVNTHATQDLYVKWYNRTAQAGSNQGTPSTVVMSSTNYYVKIAAGQDRQFQFEDIPSNPKVGVEIFIQGSGATTTYHAVKMKKV